VHGDLATLGIKVAPSTVWEILKAEGITRATARHHDLGRHPALPSRNAARLRLHRDRHLIRDRDGKFPAIIDEVLADAGIQTVLCGVRVPRTNAIMERWVQSCRHELLDRTLIWNERHLRHALYQYEQFYNTQAATRP
jgi:hypothetical protein